jgi:hypothetical protein
MSQGALNGVRIGPQELDARDNVGVIGSDQAAIRLLQLHHRSYPLELQRALTLDENKPRSGSGLDSDEVRKVIGKMLPKGSELEDFKVRGREDSGDKYLTFSYQRPDEQGNKGRSAKGCVPYDRDTFPKSSELGDAAVKLAELKEGEGASIQQLLLALSGGALKGAGSGADAAENAALKERAERAEREAKELREAAEKRDQADAEAQAEAARQAQAAADAVNTGGAGGGELPHGDASKEPYEGYDKDNADQVKSKINDSEHPLSDQTLRDIIAYEEGPHGKGTRQSIVTAARVKLTPSAT